jgi:opacity protein-like surface antigen
LRTQKLKISFTNKLLVLSLIAFSSHSNALVLVQQISVPIGTEFDTNPTLVSSRTKQSIWRYTLNPRYRVSTTENLNRWYADAGLRIVRSSNKKITDDRQDPSLDLGWDRELEKGSFGIVLHYDKASSRFTELRTDGLVDKDGSATNKSISANWTHQINNKLNLSLNGQYSKTSYVGSNFTNSSNKSISATLNYELNEKVSPFVTVGMTEFSPAGKKTRSKNILVGAKVIITPNFTVSPAFGINNESSAGSGWIANTSFNYIGEKYLLGGSIARNVSPSAVGNFQKTDRLGLTYSYELSEKDRFGADLSWTKNKSDFDSETKQLSGWYSREINNNWQMRLFAETKHLTNGSLKANGNVIGINLTYNTPEF